MGIIVPCKSNTYYIHSTLADCDILKYLLLNLVFGVTLDTQTYIWFSKVILPQEFRIRLVVTYFGQDISC